MDSPIQEIKERLDIVDLIRSYIPLIPAGKNFKALCPFHKEKTPSFMVSPDRQTWHCFGQCSEGGDIFKFLMKYENLEFYEALKVLAEKAGIELKHLSPQDQKQFGVLYDINEVAKNFFKKELEESPEVLKYVSNRGLKKEIADEFELGFASPNFDKLTLYLINIGFDVRDIERSGLIFKTERGGYIDRFRGRLMFPIYNTFGKVVAFSGRILPQYEPARNASPHSDAGGRGDEGIHSAGSGFAAAKYINSPETPVFNKSRIFYGLHKTKNDIKEQNTAVLVEGQMDFLMLYQDGVRNVVATSGTALTQDHLKILRRFTDQLILSFDNDEAGIKAAERSIDLAGANDFNVKLLTLTEFKDPAEAVEKKPGHIRELLGKTIQAMEFYFSRYLKDKLNIKNQISKIDVSDFKKNLRMVLGKIKNLASPIEKSHWLKQLSDRVDLSEQTLMEEMERIKLGKPDIRGEIADAQRNLRQDSFTRRDLIAERLLSLIITRGELREKIGGHLEYLPQDYLMILESLKSQKREIDERLQALLNIITLRSSFELEVLGEEKIEDEFQNLLRQIQYEYLKEKRQGLLKLIKETERKGEETELQLALKEFDEISKIMQNSI